MNRRVFLVTAGAAAGSLMLGIRDAGGRTDAAALEPGPFVRIDPDDTVTVTCARAEMGQGPVRRSRCSRRRSSTPIGVACVSCRAT